ncbi:cytochrome c biogenesis protein ResB [Streptomyces sp. TS71-3]|uniref:cytochrome c biogenesis protein ResB n=1 Tax=Streptomyces sp. TS71-3 TaxID=2733862 RepID=UPI001AFE6F32|nr:cytochrome c biogenesis protein ResB [Streptomyces sp. TS71-3]GHJ34805.1 cytochrome c biosynthesis protein [Streptomyces sp. TS71-3]
MSKSTTHTTNDRDGVGAPQAEDPPQAEDSPRTAGSPQADGSGASDDREYGAAGSQLSTAPREETLANLPSMGVIGWARWFWRQLTSMRVALLLLLLLSLAAIPGSLIPQNSNDLKVQEFRTAHTTLAPVYDKLGLFHVYSSVWFSAIYILLFISLIGCIVPRTWQFVGQLRGRPPGAPRKLDRLPVYSTWRTAAGPDEVREIAYDVLRRRRFRTHTVNGAVAAEKGYLRETGNLIFHIALVVMLVAFASGQLFKSEGSKLIVEGDGFANTLTQYDDFSSGNLFDPGDLPPFSFTLQKFVGTYERSGPNRGTPRTYKAYITYSDGVDGAPKKTTIQVNEPLKISGSKVYLINHGFAPTVTVRDGRGKVVYHDSVPLLPIDSNETSSGAIKVLDGYRNAAGKREQLGFNAFFVPSFAGAGKGQMFSTFPSADNPVLALSAYHGDLGVDSGVPQNVYQLDTAHLKKFEDAKGALLKQRLKPGQTMKLPNGEGSITFDRNLQQWASFQITHQPGSGWALGGAIAAIGGLAGSLFIQRRRVWVRATAGPDGRTVVEMAGLGRSESARLPQELGDLAALVHDRAPSVRHDDVPPDTPDTPDTTGPNSASGAAGAAPSGPDAAGTSTPEPHPHVASAEGATK